MAFTKSQAKSILQPSEFTFDAVTIGTRLQKLTKAEANDFVVCACSVCDQEINVAQKQQLRSQSKADQQQTNDKSRSELKAASWQEIHQAFIDRQSVVTVGRVQVAADVKATSIARRTRKVINRVDRMVVRQEVAQT